jgi:translation initiation factor 1
MDLQDQLKIFSRSRTGSRRKAHNYTFKRTYDLQIRKRKGKVTTVIEGLKADADFKILAKEIKTKLSVGTFKDDSIIIQGDYRDKIMEILKLKGFSIGRLIKECQLSVLVFT